MTSSNVDEDLMPTFEQMVAFYTAHIAECFQSRLRAAGQGLAQRGDVLEDDEILPPPVPVGKPAA